MLGCRRRRKSALFRRRLLSKREAQPFPAEPSFPAHRQEIAPAAIGFLPARHQGSESSAPVYAIESHSAISTHHPRTVSGPARLYGRVFATPCGSSFSGPALPALSSRNYCSGQDIHSGAVTATSSARNASWAKKAQSASPKSTREICTGLCAPPADASSSSTPPPRPSIKL